MKRSKMVVLVVGALVPSAAIGIAVASPSSGVTPTAHAVGARLAEDVKVNADRIKFQTKDPTDVSMLTLTVAPGGTTGWHSHPGLAIIAVTEGTGTLSFADCSSKSIRTGEAFVESGYDPPTKFSNDTSTPVVLTVTFVAPQGAAIIRDEADPACG